MDDSFIRKASTSDGRRDISAASKTSDFHSHIAHFSRVLKLDIESGEHHRMPKPKPSARSPREQPMPGDSVTKFGGVFWSVFGTMVSSLAFGGWATNEFVHTLAKKEDMLIVQNKADFVLDQHIASIVSQISYLERKPNKTPAELQQLAYLRQQLEIIRKVRSGR